MKKGTKLKPEPVDASVLEKLYETASDEEAKAAALAAWAEQLEGKKDTEFLYRLKDIFWDDQLPESVRLQAYIGILKVSGMEKIFWPENWDQWEYADWDLVTILVR